MDLSIQVEVFRGSPINLTKLDAVKTPDNFRVEDEMLKHRKAKRQAVVIIHGIGEQWPMSTLRSFVEATIKTGQSFYSKPDRISDTLELRRLSINITEDNSDYITTDFYEFYWQHLMTGTTFAHTRAWILKLLRRCPTNVPKKLFLIWITTWAAAILYIALSFSYVVWFSDDIVTGSITTIIFTYVLSHLICPILEHFTLNYLGDAARYLSPTPENVAIRHSIRSNSLDLLRKLHLDNRYERTNYCCWS